MHPKATDVWAAFSSSGVRTWCNSKQARVKRRNEAQHTALASQQGSGGKAQAAEGIYPPGAQFTHTSLLQGTRQPHTHPSLLLQSTGTTALLRLGLTPSLTAHRTSGPHNLPGVMCSAPASYKLCVHGTSVGPHTLVEHFQPKHLQTPLCWNSGSRAKHFVPDSYDSFRDFQGVFFPCFLVFLFKKGLFTFTLHYTSQIPLPHTVLGQSLLHSMSHTVQLSAAHQEARQTEISLSNAETASL